MPPINLWPTLAVTAGFAVAFSAGAVVGVLEGRRNGWKGTVRRWAVLNAMLAAGAWILVYRIFFPS